MLSHEQNALFNTDSSTPSPITTQYDKICTPPLPSEIVSYSFFWFRCFVLYVILTLFFVFVV